MNRRMFFYKTLSFSSAFYLKDAQASEEVTWPSYSAMGSIQKQTIELIALLQAGFIINCRPGVFVLNNPINIEVEHVDIRGALGPKKTKLHCLNARKGGIALRGANYVNILHLHMYWPLVTKKARNHWGAGLMLIESSSVNVSSSSVHGSPGAGFHFNQCKNISVDNLFVENTLGDGIHFQNSSNCNGYKLRTSNTGDDGVAIVDYLRFKKSSNFYLEKITVVGSVARGIAFVGARDGVLKDFSINQTSSNGLHIEQDAHYKTRNPENIQIFSGTIDGTGAYPPLRKNKFGVNIIRAKNVSLVGVEIISSKRFGCFISQSQAIKMIGISIDDSRSASLYVLNSTNVFLSNVQIKGSFNPFMNLVGVLDLNAEEVEIIDQSQALDVEVLFVHKSKLRRTKNVNIHRLKLDSTVKNEEKCFLFNVGGVDGMKIGFVSKKRIKILGSGNNVEIFKVF